VTFHPFPDAGKENPVSKVFHASHEEAIFMLEFHVNIQFSAME
jgi:hypothetical protein